jgi:hypothetical protein
MKLFLFKIIIGNQSILRLSFDKISKIFLMVFLMITINFFSGCSIVNGLKQSLPQAASVQGSIPLPPPPRVIDGVIDRDQLILNGLSLSKVTDLTIFGPHMNSKFEVVYSSDTQIIAFALAPVVFSAGAVYSLLLEDAHASPPVNNISHISVADGIINGNLVVGIVGKDAVGNSVGENDNNILQIHGKVGSSDYYNYGKNNLQLRIFSDQGTLSSPAMDVGVLDDGSGIIQVNEKSSTLYPLYLNPLGGPVVVGSNYTFGPEVSPVPLVSPSPYGTFIVADDHKATLVIDSSNATGANSANDGSQIIFRSEGGATDQSNFSIKTQFNDINTANMVYFQRRSDLKLSGSVIGYDVGETLMAMDLSQDTVGIAVGPSPTPSSSVMSNGYLNVGNSSTGSTGSKSSLYVTGGQPSGTPVAKIEGNGGGASLTVLGAQANVATVYFKNTAATRNEPVALFEATNGTQGVITIKTGTTSCILTPANTAGSVVSCTSDERLKKDIHPLLGEESLKGVLDLQPVSFRWKKGSEEIQHGFIAQQVRKVFPKLVMEGSDGYLALGTGGMIPYLVGAVQQLYLKWEKLSNLEDRFKAIEKENQSLRQDLRELKSKMSALEHGGRIQH